MKGRVLTSILRFPELCNRDREGPTMMEGGRGWTERGKRDRQVRDKYSNGMR